MKAGWEVEAENYHEVLFPGRHVSHLPSGPYDYPLAPDLPFQNERVIIQSLYHVTHQREFMRIFQDDERFHLKSHEKKGKHGRVNDGRPMGNSYVALHNDGGPPTEDSRYQYRNPEGAPLLPGSYIWWSVGIEPQVPQVEIPPKLYASEIFSDYQSSVYGSRKIFGNFKDVLVAYQESFGKDLPPPIELRIGGTLRYKREVCHVVIVNAAIHHHNGVRNDNYPIWNDAEGVRVEIRYDQNNRVIRAEASFIVKNGLTGRGLSWDHVVFAFYFPVNESEMVCRKPPFDDTEVHHSRERCLRSRWDHGQKLCPDDPGYY